MAYIVTNKKPRLIGGFVPNVTVIADDRHLELFGKADAKDEELTCPQRFFKEQVEIGNLVVTPLKSKALESSDPVDIVAGMNKDEALKFCKECGDASVLLNIKNTDKRSYIVKAAEKRIKELTQE